MMRRQDIATLAIVVVIADALWSQPVATFRGRDRQTVTVEQADADGVAGTYEGSRVVVTWDRVQSIEGGGASYAAYLDAGELLWRGATRLDRGDPVAALAALEEAYAVFGANDGPTGALAADALLDAQLSVSNAERAVEPWLRLLEHDRSQGRPLGARRSPIDDRTGLLPQLPPIFVPSRTAARSAAELAGNDFGEWTPGPTQSLAEAYASAFMIAAGERPPPLAGSASSEGVRLVQAMVEARSGDGMRRAAARAELEDLLDTEQPAWVRAWCHAGIGFSLLLGSERDRLAGVGYLLVVPGAHGETQPYLAGLCLARAAEVLAEAGRYETAGTLLDELERRSPRHPALSQPSLRGIRTFNAPRPDNGT